MASHRARPAPRHRGSDRLSIGTPGRRTTVVAGVLLALLAGSGFAFAGDEVGGALSAVRTMGETPKAEVVEPPVLPEPSATETPERTRVQKDLRAAKKIPYVVVEPQQIRKETEQERRARLAKLVEAKVAKKAEEAAGTIPSFGVAMFNILGSQHSAGSGGYGPGTSRAYTATRMLLSKGVSLIGFSEIQRDQVAVFRNNAPGWQVWPGDALGAKGVPQSVAWNTSVWTFVEARTISIPFSGQIRPQPIVKLAHTGTGSEIWFMNVHNSPQGMEGERDTAMAAEVSEINRLAATGVPIILTGDFNEKEEAFCRFTGSTPLVSAVGGSSDGGCFPPRPSRVDWIFVSPEFARESFLVTREAPVPSITDHYALYARLSIS